MKEIKFLGNSLENIQLYSDAAKKRTGYELHKIQHGLKPNNWKPITSVGSGVKEIKVSASDGIYRTIYIAKFKEVVYVFRKKIRKYVRKILNWQRNDLKRLEINNGTST